MGTSFYHKRKGKKKRHIGLSSCGWCFQLHVIPEKGIHNLDDWIEKLEKGWIVDEYGRKLTKEELMRTIQQRSNEGDRTLGEGDPPPKWGLFQDSKRYDSWKQFLDINHAEIGPNNLMRARIDGRCIGHGAGTWDLVTGEFS